MTDDGPTRDLMATSGRPRVVVTGLGAVTPLGSDVRSTWENLVAGRATAGPITAFDATGFPVTFACEATSFDPGQWIDRKQARRMDRFAQMVVAAARQAQSDAGLEIEPECDRVGVSFGTAMGGLKSFEDMMSGVGMDEATGKEFERVMKGYHDLVETGHREIYKIEADA